MLDSMPSYQRFSEREFFGSLNGLRAIAALLVVWHHCHQGIDFGRIGTRMGHVGVSLFFVLSGFLIVTLLIRERRKTADIDLRAFYGRRTLRIMPLYYAVVILTLLFVLGFDSGSSEAEALRVGLPYLLTYTTNWVPVVSFLAITWTLATEEQFYLFWPQIQKRIADSIWVPAALLVLSEAIRFRLLDPVFHALGWDLAKAPLPFDRGFHTDLVGCVSGLCAEFSNRVPPMCSCFRSPLCALGGFGDPGSGAPVDAGRLGLLSDDARCTGEPHSLCSADTRDWFDRDS